MKLAKRSLALALILLLLVLPAASRPQTKEDIRRSVAVKKFEDTSIFQTKPTETGWDFSRSKDKTEWDYNYKTEFHLSTTSGPVVGAETTRILDVDNPGKLASENEVPTTTLVALNPDNGSVRWARVVEPSLAGRHWYGTARTPQEIFAMGSSYDSQRSYAVVSPDGRRVAVQLVSYMTPATSERISDQRTNFVVLDAETGDEVRTVNVSGMVLGHVLTNDSLVIETAQNAFPAGTGTLNAVPLDGSRTEPTVTRTDQWLIGSTADSLLLAPQEFGMRDECRGCHSFTITRVGITGEEMGTMPGIAQLRPAGWVERFKDPAAAAEIINRGGDPKEIGFALRKLPRELVDVDSGTVIDPGDLSPSEIPTPTGPAILLEKASKDKEGHDISPVVSWLNVAAGEKTPRTDDLTYLTDKNNFNGVAAERIRMGEETNTW